jgi:5-methylcytosine-specific restriction protein A
MPRLEFPRKVRQAIKARANGHCERCKSVLKVGEGEIDHILTCALGGEPTVANGRLLCRACHKEKTADDVRSLRHGDRMRDKHSGVIRPTGKLRGAPFPKTERSAKRAAKPALPPKPLFEERT